MFTIHKDQTAENLRAYDKLTNVEHRTAEGLRKAFYFIGARVVRDARRYIKSKDKTGRVYLVRIGGRLKRHQASAPYESPANMTGALQKSLGFTVHGHDSVEVGAEASYAGYLEKGTSKMIERPYLKKAIEANRRYIHNTFAKEIDRALRGRD